MTDVRDVFITSEVSDVLKITPSYLIRVSKEMNFEECEFREAGKRNYLFSKSAIEKLSKRFSSNKQ